MMTFQLNLKYMTFKYNKITIKFLVNTSKEVYFKSTEKNIKTMI